MYKRQTSIVTRTKYGADPNFQNNEGETAVFVATSAKNPQVLQLLCDYGADPNHVNKGGMTALMKMLMRNDDFHETTLINLITDCADIGQTNSKGQTLAHLIGAVHGCNRKRKKKTHSDSDDHICVRFLSIMIDRGFDISTKDGLQLTPLHAAAASCSDATKLLIESGADVNARSMIGETPLHWLGFNSDNPDFDVLFDMFVKAGASVDDLDDHGQSILHYITTSNSCNGSAIRSVLERGALVNRRNKFGLTPLHLCVVPSIFKSTDDYEEGEEKKRNVTSSIATFAEKGAEINATDADELTPLHAVPKFEGKVETVRTLIELGSDVNMRTKSGETALHRATLYSNLLRTLIQTCSLKKKTLDFNAIDYFGSTALHWAVYYSETGSIEQLLEAGANPHIRDFEGRSPIELAVLLERTSLFPSLGLPYTLLERSRQDNMWYKWPRLVEMLKPPSHWYVNSRQHEQSLKCFAKTIMESESSGLLHNTSENTAVADSINAAMSYISAKLANMFPVFDCELQLSGSWKEKTKVCYPDEFDYDLILKQFSSAFSPVETSEDGLGSYVKFHLNDEHKHTAAFDCFVDVDGYLDGRKLLKELYASINGIFASLPADLPKCMYAVKYLDTKTGSIDHLSFCWVGCIYEKMLVDVDVVPVLKTHNWLPSSFKYSPTKKLFEVFGIAGEVNYSAVLKTPDSKVSKDGYSLFRLSFSDVEAKIIGSINRSALKGFILLKALLRSLNFPQIYLTDEGDYEQRAITTYHLKTCLFHELEAYCEQGHGFRCAEKEDNYSEQAVLDWAERITSRLLAAIELDYLESYFNPKQHPVNLLANKSLYRFPYNSFYRFEAAVLAKLVNVIANVELPVNETWMIL